MGETPKAYLLGGLIEQESCISLKHSRCWDPSSKLKTPREYGVGLGQITIAYNTNGTIRFDALEEIRAKHRPELYELSWLNVKARPDLQIKAIILKMKDNYNYYSKTTKDPLAFADASYNGGIGSLDKERRACYISKDCDASLWFGNVENYCMKSKAALYGTRSACFINREHVTNVLLVRSSKYDKFFK